MRCPWCGNEIEVKARTIVRKVIKPQTTSLSKGEGKDRIEVVAPPAKTKAKARGKK